MSRNQEIRSYYAKEYQPIKMATLDGTGSYLNDKACLRAMRSKYDVDKINEPTKYPMRTLFVGRLDLKSEEESIKKAFKKYGNITQIKLIRDIVTGDSKGYCFIEFSTEYECKSAYKDSDNMVIDNKRILVDYERARIMKGWKPRRLGGGLGGLKHSGQLRFGGRDKPFKPPFRKNNADILKVPIELTRSDCWRPSIKDDGYEKKRVYSSHSHSKEDSYEKDARYSSHSHQRKSEYHYRNDKRSSRYYR